MVPARDFDPARDAARIETAIKTKGERVQENSLPNISLPSPPVRKFPLSYVTVIPPLLSPSLTVCTGNAVHDADITEAAATEFSDDVSASLPVFSN